MTSTTSNTIIIINNVNNDNYFAFGSLQKECIPDSHKHQDGGGGFIIIHTIATCPLTVVEMIVVHSFRTARHITAATTIKHHHHG